MTPTQQQFPFNFDIIFRKDVNKWLQNKNCQVLSQIKFGLIKIYIYSNDKFIHLPSSSLFLFKIFDLLIKSNMPTFIHVAVFTLFLLTVALEKECLEYQSGTCIRCPPNMTLFNGNCIDKIPGCIKYINQSTCAQCNQTLFQLQHTQCTPIYQGDAFLMSNITLYQLAAFANYQQIPLQKLSEDSGFVRCDSMLRSGQYHHFISRTSQPIYFVAYSQLQTWRNYQVIYQASGGGLLLCIVNFDTASQAIAIQSIVSIGTSQLVEHCLSYTPYLQCNYCRKGYHLDARKCHPDIEGCSSYHKNICLALENRCIGCTGLCDTANIQFYHWKTSE